MILRGWKCNPPTLLSKVYKGGILLLWHINRMVYTHKNYGTYNKKIWNRKKSRSAEEKRIVLIWEPTIRWLRHLSNNGPLFFISSPLLRYRYIFLVLQNRGYQYFNSTPFTSDMLFWMKPIVKFQVCSSTLSERATNQSKKLYKSPFGL